MRDRLEHAHLDHLGVDQDQLEFVGPLGVQEAHDDRVHAHALARAGGAGDEHVGHGVEVLHQRVAAGVFAQEHGQLHLRHGLAVHAHQLFEPHAFLLDVGHFDADGVFAGHVGHHTDVGGPQGAGQVAVHRGDAADLGARCQAYLKQRDDRARVDVDDLALDAVFEQRGLKLFALLAHDVVHLFAEAVFGLFEQVDARELVTRQVHLADGRFVRLLLLGEVDGHLRHLGPQRVGVEVLFVLHVGVGRVGGDVFVVVIVGDRGGAARRAGGLALGPRGFARRGLFFLGPVDLFDSRGPGAAPAAGQLDPSAFQVVLALRGHAGKAQPEPGEAGHLEAGQGGDRGEALVHRGTEFDHAFGHQPRQGQHHLIHGQQRADPEGQGQQQQRARRGEAGHQLFLNQQPQQAAGAFGPPADAGDKAVGGHRDQARGGGGHDRQAHGPQHQLVDGALAEGQHDAGAQAQHRHPHARADDQVGLVSDRGSQRPHPVLGRGVGDAHHVAGRVRDVVAEQRGGHDEPRHAGHGQADLFEGGEALGLLLLGGLFLFAGGHREHLRRAVGVIESEGRASAAPDR